MQKRWEKYLLEEAASLPAWKMLYEHFRSQHKIIESAECVLQSVQLLPQNQSEKECAAFFDEKAVVFFAAAVLLLQEKKAEEALRFIGWMKDVLPEVPYYKAMAYYQMENFQQAQALFEVYLHLFEGKPIWQVNENVFFYLGNCFFHQGNMISAIQWYQKTIEARKSFAEAMINMALAFQVLGDDDTAKVLRQGVLKNGFVDSVGAFIEHPYLDLQFPAGLNEFQIPIFINSRDRLLSLEQQVQWFLHKGYKKIYVLDNDSTYQPLLKYYMHLEDDPQVHVVFLRRNLGHTALWSSGILEILNIKTPYVYTDSDVIPVKECPADYMKKFLQVLRENPLIQKAGFSICLDDLTFYDRKRIQAYEQRYWEHSIEPNLFYAAVDTTLAVYRNTRYYAVRDSFRLGKPYTVRHLPYYYDYEHLPEDEKYYIEHANVSSSLAMHWRNIITPKP